MPNRKEKLFSDFSAPSTQEWLDKIQVDLKGADFEKRLVWRTNEGFKVQPFYRKEDLEGLTTTNALPGEYPYLRGNRKDNNNWNVRQDVECADAAAANEKAKTLISKGCNAIGFHLSGNDVTDGYVAELLKGIDLEKVEVNFSTCQRHCLDLARILLELFSKSGVAKGAIHGSIEFDPIEKMMLGGHDTTPILNSFAKPMVETLADYPNFQTICIKASTLSDSGAYIYQELGYALSWGNEYMNLLTEAGLSAELVASKLKFIFGVGSNYFMEIAKLRAARMLWSSVANEYGVSKEGCKMHICCVTSSYNQTIYDSYVNLLRSQTEAMSAALAGVDSIVVTPFDASYESPTDFSERIARNQQLILKEECHFNKIVDVSAGSYYIENLTKSIAEQAWKVFLSVEEKEGFLAAAVSGEVQKTVNATNTERHQNAAKRKEFILGTNQFPNFTENSDGKSAVTCGESCSHNHADSGIERLAGGRLADDFEALRLQTEKAPKQPVAFMLTIGNLVMRQARAQFSCNFLACAGYKVIDNLGFPTVEEGVEAAVKAGADIVVICSSDDEYADYAVPAFKCLDGRAMFVVAGAPACSDDLKAAGIENFIHVRVNQLETLKDFNAKLGIK